MTEQLIVHDSFRPVLTSLKNNPPQGILLHGIEGVGLLTIARSIAGKTAIVLQPQTKKGEVDLTGGTITIERIRGLYEQTRSGSVSFVIVDNAELLSAGAQNAFLKLLEEPGKNLHFILTSHHPERLLATIRSRVIGYHVPPISDAQSRAILSKANLTNEQVLQAMFLAQGRPASLLRICEDHDSLRQLGGVMADAKRFLNDTSRYERVGTAFRYGASRASALELTDAALRIMQHTLYQKMNKGSGATAQRLLTLHEALSRNANPRLQLIQFVLE